MAQCEDTLWRLLAGGVLVAATDHSTAEQKSRGNDQIKRLEGHMAPAAFLLQTGFPSGPSKSSWPCAHCHCYSCSRNPDTHRESTVAAVSTGFHGTCGPLGQNSV